MSRYIKYIAFIIAMGLFSFSYAGELVIKEAKNYFKDGVEAQKNSNFDAAMMAYNKAMLVDSKDMPLQKYVINNIGIMYADLDEPDKAEAAFLEALKLDPNYKEAHLNLALVYQMRGDELKSLRELVKAHNLEDLKPKNFAIDEGPKEEPNKAKPPAKTSK